MSRKTKAEQPAVRPPYRDNSAREILGDLLWIDIDALKTPSTYARKRSQSTKAMLRGAIETFEVLFPGVIDRDNHVLDGVARVEEAKALGYTKYPVFRVSHLDPTMAAAFSIAANRIGARASWDEKQLFANIDMILLDHPDFSVENIGFTIGEVDALRVEVVDQNPADEIPEIKAAPVSRLGDLWYMGPHRLLCGSSLEAASWQRLMDGAIAAMMFSDPPYNVPIAGHVSGLGKVRHDNFKMACGELDSDGFIAFLEAFLRASIIHCKDGAVLQVCMDWAHQWELLTASRRVGLSQLNLCIWNKTNGGMGSLYRSKHELIGIFKHGNAPHRNCIELGKHGRHRTNVWDYAGTNSFSNTRSADLADHPTVKPVALVADAICDVTAPGEIVIDAFVGSGTTILAADRVRRVAYGIEIDPLYVDVAIRRFEAQTGRQAVLADSGQTFAQVERERSAPAVEALQPFPVINPPARRRA